MEYRLPFVYTQQLGSSRWDGVTISVPDSIWLLDFISFRGLGSWFKKGKNSSSCSKEGEGLENLNVVFLFIFLS